MIKVHGLIKILLIFSFLCCLISCKEKEFNIEEHNNVFLDHFSTNEEIAERDISHLELYYYNSYYYYDVAYTKTTNDKDYRLLYILRYGAFDMYFSIKNENDAKEHFGNYYNRYLEAKEKGESKIFTIEEIQALIDNYYN